MNMPLKVIKVGNSSGVILPKEVLAHLKVEQGDRLSLVRTSDGITLRAADEDFDQQMRIARAVMKRRRAALRELAK
ncbi:MAG: AbrB/MazE/SpoVT family DNA-binding domain-containing protein [Sphingomonadaceae bacterium]